MTKQEKSRIASMLGKLGKGHKKTMTPAAMAARKANAQRPRTSRRAPLRKRTGTARATSGALAQSKTGLKLKDIERARRALLEGAAPVTRDRKGRPVYTLYRPGH